ncbi:acyltransferase [Paraferrimonas sedimenticola]|uniref:Acyltransferase n=1 Tax=Paraferrimonas sedimenticola TaxID=375674 RepID=A0AA37RXK6_9GAMM|nr:acyltransferase [Paraferrimonas sedimenticola]GLP96749.1 acyltransferase [Paraferrimonas sedimenticola]
MIAKTAIVHPNVELGENVIIEDYCIIGTPSASALKAGDQVPVTRIGDNSVIRAHTIIYAGNQIGRGFQTGNRANIRENNTIGDNVSVGTGSVVEHSVTIEDGVRIHSQAFVPEFCVLKAHCWIGPNVVLTNAKYPQSESAKQNLIGPTVGENARIGANSTVLPGVDIGERALIGAGSLVSKPVEAKKIVVGNPAKVVGEVDY